jgi:hypothetical protein
LRLRPKPISTRSISLCPGGRVQRVFLYNP